MTQYRNPYRWWNIIALIAVIIVNFLAERLPINGITTGELSAKYPVLVTPAGYAFSIWTLIYVLLIGFVIYQARPKASESRIVRSIGPWFILSCLFNIAWIFIWHYEYVTASVCMMLALLISLIALYIKTNHTAAVPTKGERFLVQMPFRIYLGWICVATIVNVSVGLYAAGWRGAPLTETAWAVIVLLLGAALAFVIGKRYTDPYIMLVFVWAYIAIAIKQQDNHTVVTTALIAAALLLVYAALLLLRRSSNR